MKDNKLHIAKGIFLLLLTVTLLFSSAGIYYVSKTTKTISVKEEKAKKETGKKEQVSVAHVMEAVVVSVLYPDFAQYILVISFDFSVLTDKVILSPKRFLISEKYFRTLFTHIISPNAP